MLDKILLAAFVVIIVAALLVWVVAAGAICVTLIQQFRDPMFFPPKEKRDG